MALRGQYSLELSANPRYALRIAFSIEVIHPVYFFSLEGHAQPLISDFFHWHTSTKPHVPAPGTAAIAGEARSTISNYLALHAGYRFLSVCCCWELWLLIPPFWTWHTDEVQKSLQQLGRSYATGNAFWSHLGKIRSLPNAYPGCYGLTNCV